MPVETPDWVSDAVFYQIFPDRFAASDRLPKAGLEPWDAPPTRQGFKGGDLLGVAERLPYLADLGVTALYLNPIFASASNHRYHTYDYFRVDPLLGGDEALRELLDTAHARGIRVILDGVFNHTGRGFWPFHHVLEAGAASPYRSWFHLDDAAMDAGLPLDAYPESRLRRSVVAGAPFEGVPVDEPPRGGDGSSVPVLGYQAWWDLPPLPKLNLQEPAVREHLLSAAEYWLRFGIDGWRLDVPEEIPDGAFWSEFRRRCRLINPDAYLVGEIWHVAPEWLAGDRFDGLMNYPLAEAILGFVAGSHLDAEVVESHHEFGQRVRALDGAGFGERLLELTSAYEPPVVRSQLNLLDSHDTPRFLTMTSGDRAAYRLAVLLQATLPGAPCIYYGDEVGLEGGLDPDCRRAFPWSEERRDRDTHAFVRAALSARHAERSLRRGSVRLLGVADDSVVFERGADGGDGDRVLVAVNAGEAPTEVRLSDAAAAVRPWGPARVEAVSLPGWTAPGVRLADDGRWTTVVMEPRSGAVLREG